MTLAADRADARIARRILHVRGRVQGVGFRPFVYRGAVALGLRGAVWNEADGVVIDLEGDPAAIARLRTTIESGAPPQARVEALESETAPPLGYGGFEIRASAGRGAVRARVVPDLASCAACLAELEDAGDRRFHYPFLNCTDCGPRYSIARGVPYDRARTTMSRFAMCGPCSHEYHDPRSRRFHAQPNACGQCGPRLRIEPDHGGGDALAQAVRALRAGQILALKGLGGFHLACDARSGAAVRRLRECKHRPAKPFAVMFPSLARLADEASLSPAERAALISPRAPIVLLAQRPDASLAREVAPGLRELGAFLPYTPLHHRLLAAFDGPLVMTSGNLSEEPIVASNAEARARLGALADRLLLHDREIHARVEDSIVRVMRGEPRVLRRARGWVPEVVELDFDAPPLLAVGADLKNTLCLTQGRAIVPGPHAGDLAHWEARQLFEEIRARLEVLFQIQPAYVAHDLHPGYHATALARATRLPRVAVQHHHAHVAACLVENGRRGPAIGVAWDGSGFGPDGSVWGGEFLVADLARYTRLARLRPVPLPGGDAAVREPARMALAHLLEAGLPGRRIEVASRAALETMIRRGWNAPPTSSAGRLFDAVAALVGVCARASYEGQAAAELEARSEPGAAPYPFPLREAALLELDPRPLVRAIVRDLDAGVSVERIGGRFHAALAHGIARTCERIRARTGLATVALSGGCFQNRLLLETTAARLEQAGFEALSHASIPPGDGGIAIGQAAVAGWRLHDVPRDSR